MGVEDRLAVARAGGLVGRAPEQAALAGMLAGGPDAPVVAYLHGPGGIGKSALARDLARRAGAAGRPVVHVEARPGMGEAELESAAAPALVEAGAVLVIDAFQHCQRLEAWVRESLLLRLAPDAIALIASRVAPDPEWSLDIGWDQCFVGLPLGPLSAAQSVELLAARGVAPERRKALAGWVGGTPLALCLAASVVAPTADVSRGWRPTGEVLTTLVERLVGDLPSGARRRALEVAAQAHFVRESLLRKVLGDDDTTAVFAWLRQLPYIEVTERGLRLHDAVRSSLDAELRWRDPARYLEVRARLSAAALEAVRASSDDEMLARVEDWYFLFRDHGSLRSMFDWRSRPQAQDAALLPEDLPELLRLAREVGGDASAAVAAYWARQQPAGFRLYRMPSSPAPVAFMAILTLHRESVRDRAADPVVARIWDHVAQVAPLAPGEHLAIRRFGTNAGTPQHPSPTMNLMSERQFAEEMRATGRALTYTVMDDADPWRPYLADALMQEVATVEVGGHPQSVFARDWRHQSMDEWVVQRADPGRVVAGITEVPDRRDPGRRADFEQAVMDALRTWHAPRELATSALLGTSLVAPGSLDPVADLRTSIENALRALEVDPAGVRAREVLHATYISASRTHKAAAMRLGLPYGTYRRRLADARGRLVGLLSNQLEPPATPPSPPSAGG